MVIIGLENPKSPSNVGAILRAANCFAADQILYTGTRFDRAARYHTDTHGFAKNTPPSAVADLIEAIDRGVEVVAVELVVGAVPLPRFVHPKDAIYVFGPEDGSLSQSLVDRADHVVYIPCTTCLNLAATVNVVLYDRMAKTSITNDADAQIVSSRDTNNRLVRQ